MAFFLRSVQRRSRATLFATCVAASACTTVDQAPRQIIYTLVDFSGTWKARRPAFEHFLIDTLLPALAPHDRLVVLPIDGDAFQTPERLIDVNLDNALSGDYGFAHADERRAQRVATFVDSVRPVLQRRMADAGQRRNASETDLLGALQHLGQARRDSVRTPSLFQRLTRFAAGEPSVDSTITILIGSDMIQEGQAINFAKDPLPDHDGALRMIEALRKRGLVPSLRGMTILVTGAYARSPAAVRQVRDFWFQFFDATGATMPVYDYDASTIILERLRRHIAK